MGYYLLDNPPAIQQFHTSRANPLTGGILIHTAESVMDDVGPDTGAENVAGIISRRTDYGSYHILVDYDSSVPMMPDSYTAFHCAADGYNSRTWGISFACRTTDLDPGRDWTKKAMKIAAAEIVAFWKRNNFDPLGSAKFIPAAQTKSGPGMSTHGEAQPADRSDAWTRHPKRAELEKMLLGYIIDLVEPQPIPGQDCKMKRVMMRNPKNGEIALFWEELPWRVRLTAKQVEVYKYFGIPYKGDVDAFFFDTTVRLQNGA